MPTARIFKFKFKLRTKKEENFFFPHTFWVCYFLNNSTLRIVHPAGFQSGFPPLPHPNKKEKKRKKKPCVFIFQFLCGGVGLDFINMYDIPLLPGPELKEYL